MRSSHSHACSGQLQPEGLRDICGGDSSVRAVRLLCRWVSTSTRPCSFFTAAGNVAHAAALLHATGTPANMRMPSMWCGMTLGAMAGFMLAYQQSSGMC